MLEHRHIRSLIVGAYILFLGKSVKSSSDFCGFLPFLKWRLARKASCQLWLLIFNLQRFKTFNIQLDNLQLFKTFNRRLQARLGGFSLIHPWALLTTRGIKIPLSLVSLSLAPLSLLPSPYFQVSRCEGNFHHKLGSVSWRWKAFQLSPMFFDNNLIADR